MKISQKQDSKGILRHLLFSVLSGVLLFSTFAHAIEEDQEIKSIGDARQRKFITLTVGVEFDEKLPHMPREISKGGDCDKGLVVVEYATNVNTLRFNPRREGNCTYFVKDLHSKKILAEFRLTIRKSKLDDVMHDIQALIGDIEGVNIKIVNNKVVVDGQILLPRDMNRIYNVISQFGDQAASLVTLSPLAQKKIAEFISRDINNPEIEVRAVNDKFILQGMVSCPPSNNPKDSDDYARAEIIAKTYVPDVILDKAVQDGVVKQRKASNDGIINMIGCKPQAAPAPAKMVQLVMHYVELKKTYQKGFEFLFAPALGDNSGAQFTLGNQSGGGGFVSEITGTISNFIPKLNWLKSHGYGRVLESESIIVKDQKTAYFHSGGQFYISAASVSGQTQTPVNYGLTTTIVPQIAQDGKSDTVGLDVKFDLSVPNFQTSPASLTNNTINTNIDCRSGQSAAVGGLISSQSGTSFNNPGRLPTGQDPIVRLFASKDFLSNQSQFVVFITPQIKSSASSGSEKVKKKFRLRD